jgi:hypothetical protein
MKVEHCTIAQSHSCPCMIKIRISKGAFPLVVTGSGVLSRIPFALIPLAAFGSHSKHLLGLKQSVNCFSSFVRGVGALSQGVTPSGRAHCVTVG